MSSFVSRRRFLVVTGTALGVVPALAACGGGAVAAAACPGYGELTGPQLQQRAALAYVDQTPIPAERCDNCRFYVAPVGGSPCGGCQLFAGPVAPAGYCTSWVAMAG